MKKEIKLNDRQRELAEHYMSVVDWVLMDHVKANPSVPGLSQDDLRQEGYYWLCRAAATYDENIASFGTYARKVVRNGLISYCRKLSHEPRKVPLASALPDDDDSDTCGYEPQVEADTDGIIDRTDTMDLLSRMKSRCTGTARLGVEALELKVKGFDGAEIAAMYGVKTNHVSAWIAKAAKKLRNDESVLGAFQKTI